MKKDKELDPIRNFEEYKYLIWYHMIKKDKLI
jgi:hypothetical protein